MNKIDLSGKIERLEKFEEKFGVRIENASAWFDEDLDHGSVFFELHPKYGTDISQDITVAVVVYNSGGQIVAKEAEFYYAENFWGFAVGECYLQEISLQEIFKIRIYPTNG